MPRPFVIIAHYDYGELQVDAKTSFLMMYLLFILLKAHCSIFCEPLLCSPSRLMHIFPRSLLDRSLKNTFRGPALVRMVRIHWFVYFCCMQAWIREPAWVMHCFLSPPVRHTKSSFWLFSTVWEVDVTCFFRRNVLWVLWLGTFLDRCWSVPYRIATVDTACKSNVLTQFEERVA